MTVSKMGKLVMLDLKYLFLHASASAFRSCNHVDQFTFIEIDLLFQWFGYVCVCCGT